MLTTYQASFFLTQYIRRKENCAEWNEARQCYMPYADSGDLGTIGYGHLITHAEYNIGKFKLGLSITECEQLFQQDLQKRVNLVNSLNIPNLTQGQFDALVDFCWNCGFSALNAALRDGLESFPIHCIRYVHDAKSHILQGLLTRREDEISWFKQSNLTSV